MTISATNPYLTNTQPKPAPIVPAAPPRPAAPAARPQDTLQTTPREHGYPVEDIVGIGPAYGKKLRDAGVTDTNDLLDATSTRYARQQLAQKADIPYRSLLKWAQKVELMRLKGVGPRQSNLLEAVGVDSVKELAQRDPKALHERMAIANSLGDKFVERLPSEITIGKWIEAAQMTASKVEEG
ncbi:MAG: hypothetical protein JWM80_2764 [Cyanobacteria bacterium RYN_339]|nr:hypothetical protein [Cyanobacteria bacterium RYN_339]